MQMMPAWSLPSALRPVGERIHAFFEQVHDGRTVGPDGVAAVGSIKGPYREKNEDRCAALHIRRDAIGLDLHIGIVCDGLGGLKGGDEAATIAISVFLTYCAFSNEKVVINRIRRACHQANQAVMDRFRAEAGTTLTAIVVGGEQAYSIHVGDSRAYFIDREQRVGLLTYDDTVNGAIQRHNVQYDEDELDNRLLQFVGIGKVLDPHIETVDAKSPALWMVTSDGAHFIGRKALHGIAQRANTPIDVVRKILFTADALDSHDNASAVCIANQDSGNITGWQDGLNLQITGPTGTLEIYVPEIALESMLIPASRIVPRTSKAKQAEGRASPKLKKAIRVRTKTKVEKDAPMDVIFGSDDDE